ncbi:metallophosphoesterase [Candidatus Thorarchaeota archaeon]|nr:MAG: metallophosphoesterase [Candidatus Thorarchaeota archaeon]
MELLYDDRSAILETDSGSILLISDLHLGFEEELAKQKGISFPPQQENILHRISVLVDKYSIGRLYILGDIKHTITADTPFNWQLIPEFMMALMDLVHTHIIPGNHDGDLAALLPRNVPIESVFGILLTEKPTIGLLHGHTWPSEQVLCAETLILGHNHPTIRSVRVASAPDIGREERKRRGTSIPVILQSQLDKNCVRLCMNTPQKSDDTQGLVITLPSFNELFSGVAINRLDTGFRGPLFENNCVDFLESEVFSMSGQYINSVRGLRKQFNEIVK